MLKLSKRQKEILDFIRENIEKNGMPPTRDEIKDKFGFKSHNASQCHLVALEKKGYIRLHADLSRGIQITNKDFNVQQDKLLYCPIETAPKDKIIDLWVGAMRFTECYWWTDEWGQNGKWSNGSASKNIQDYGSPSHWSEIPKGPAF